MRTYQTFSTRVTKQGEAIPGEAQVVNNADGFVYEVDKWKQFERFLILGTEGGTYYVGEQKLTRENALAVMACVNEDGVRAVMGIVDVSERGRAPKNDPAIFALALAAAAKDARTRRTALDALPRVCRIPTHLFHFVTYVKQFRGMGRGLRHALGHWYNDMPVEKLAYEVVKYQSRDGWSNRDVLRQAHPKTADPVRNAVYRWIVGGVDDGKLEKAHLPQIVAAFENAKTVHGVGLVRLIKECGLTREMIPTEALTRADVWEALLPTMPLTAMVRNLGNMSKVGLLAPMSDAARLVAKRLRDREVIKKARAHPISLLVALKTYAGGRGVKGSGQWTPVPSVIDALDDAFYLAFEALEPTGKRLLFGVDVSASMEAPITGLPISSAEAAAAMALACAKTEREFYIMGFSSTFKNLGITPNMRLDDVMAYARGVNFGRTDCAIPMVWALAHKVKVDGFVVITDNETWAGTIHPSQALRRYREATGIAAKQVVMATTSTKFSIANPKDGGALDVVGFDTTTPQVVADFLRG